MVDTQREPKGVMMHKKRILLPLIIILVAVPIFSVFSPVIGASINVQETEPVNIYYFWYDGCPYCAMAKPVLADIVDQNPNVNLYDFDIVADDNNRTLLLEFSDNFGVEGPLGVPAIFIGEKHWIGFNQSVAADIQQSVEYCLNLDCYDLGQEIYTPASQGDGVVEENNSGFQVPKAVIITGSVVGFVALFFFVDRVILKKKK